MTRRRPNAVAPTAGWLVPSVLVLATAVVPLIVRLAVRPLDGPALDFWNGQSNNYDFFSYYKACAIVGCGALAAIGLGCAWLRGRRAWVSRVPMAAWAALLAYLALVIASTAASAYQSIALGGFPDRYEGAWVLVAYASLFCAAASVRERERSVRLLVGGLAVSAGVIGWIGAFQAAGLDFFRGEVGRFAILPSGTGANAGALVFPRRAGDVYATLYHYNYVGSYAALVVPFLAAWLVSPARTVRSRIAGAVALAPLCVCWIACGSRAGWIGGAAGLLVVAIARGRGARVARPAVLVACATAVAAVGLGVAAFDTRVAGRVASLVRDVRMLVRPVPDGEQIRPPIERVIATGHTLAFRYRDVPVVLELQDAGLAARDGDGHALVIRLAGREGQLAIADGRFRELGLQSGLLRDQPALLVRAGSFTRSFLIRDGGFQPTLNTGKIVPQDPVETWGFRGREQLGSGRAYVWSRALPLLRHALVLGYGPDTFAAVFPQHDFEGKFAVYGETDMLVDKPHDLWLQAAVNTGVLSAAALTVLFCTVLITAGQRLLRGQASPEAATVTVAAVAGAVGYLVAGVFNDSAVLVAPVFWVVLGLAAGAGDIGANGVRPRESDPGAHAR